MQFLIATIFLAAGVLSAIRVQGQEGALKQQSISLLDGKFQMDFPVGYQFVERGVDGPKVFLKAKEKVDGYYRSLQVLEGDKSTYIDDRSLSEWLEKVDKQSSRIIGIVDFRVKNGQIVQFDDGKNGLVIYSGYRESGVEYTQMHLILSNERKFLHFVYTDVHSHFESEEFPYFQNMWELLSNAKLEGSAPWRYQTIVTGYVLVVSVFIGVFGAMMRRRVIENRRLTKLEESIDSDQEVQETSDFDASETAETIGSESARFGEAETMYEESHALVSEQGLKVSFQSAHATEDDFSESGDVEFPDSIDGEKVG